MWVVLAPGREWGKSLHTQITFVPVGTKKLVLGENHELARYSYIDRKRIFPWRWVHSSVVYKCNISEQQQMHAWQTRKTSRLKCVQTRSYINQALALTKTFEIETQTRLHLFYSSENVQFQGIVKLELTQIRVIKGILYPIIISLDDSDRFRNSSEPEFITFARLRLL
jgi:hypothetical protein